MRVNEIGPVLVDGLADLLKRGLVPDSLSCGPEAAIADGGVVLGEADDSVAMLFEQRCFVREDAVLASGVLIVVVEGEDFHGCKIRASVRLARAKWQ